MGCAYKKMSLISLLSIVLTNEKILFSKDRYFCICNNLSQKDYSEMPIGFLIVSMLGFM